MDNVSCSKYFREINSNGFFDEKSDDFSEKNLDANLICMNWWEKVLLRWFLGEIGWVFFLPKNNFYVKLTKNNCKIAHNKLISRKDDRLA